ncbi:hypothetical protein [Chondromyces crocatus]|uniref:Uncharacterized protein n=1 Tax=Chondromyces crocatus TaxID=52 RepID=A0A0K1E7Z5_CHOCO|nr:hypothetical protein [Chondromyces crocatus]AKT36985.1 uncharacterized protein CMC5_011110 [Chondromyces crocatus]
MPLPFLHHLPRTALGLALALVAGCDPPTPPTCKSGYVSSACPDPTICHGPSCGKIYTCRAPSPAPEEGLPDYLWLCNGHSINDPYGFQTFCDASLVDAEQFCVDQCIIAGQESGYSATEIAHLCQHVTVEVETWVENDEPLVCDPKEMAKIPYVYDPEFLCPESDNVDPELPPPVPPGSGLPSVYCHGTADPSTPSGATPHDFNDLLISYWVEQLELGDWHPTAKFELFNSGCGYEVPTIYYEGLGLTDDEMCQTFCSEVVAQRELEHQNPSDPGSARILHDNCSSFVAGSLCANHPLLPPLLGPTTVSLQLNAALNFSTHAVPASFIGTITYSTYDCPSTLSSCAMMIDALSVDLVSPVTGIWPFTSGPVAFTSSDMSLQLLEPTRATYAITTGDFELYPFSTAVNVDGAYTLGSTSGPVSVDMDALNSTAISGTIENDGSVSLSGSLQFGRGVTLTFATP